MKRPALVIVLTAIMAASTAMAEVQLQLTPRPDMGDSLVTMRAYTNVTAKYEGIYDGYAGYHDLTKVTERYNAVGCITSDFNRLPSVTVTGGFPESDPIAAGAWFNYRTTVNQLCKLVSGTITVPDLPKTTTDYYTYKGTPMSGVQSVYCVNKVVDGKTGLVTEESGGGAGGWQSFFPPRPSVVGAKYTYTEGTSRCEAQCDGLVVFINTKGFFAKTSGGRPVVFLYGYRTGTEVEVEICKGQGTLAWDASNQIVAFRVTGTRYSYGRLSYVFLEETPVGPATN